MKNNITTFSKHSMKYILLVFSICITALPLKSQSVSISVVDGYSNFGENDYPIKDGKISLKRDQIQIADHQFTNPVGWSISPMGYKTSFLENRGVLILHTINYDGQEMRDEELDFFDPSDETIQLYQFDDGRTILRDNVANFTFLDPMGNTVFSESNSSQSQDGERESQLAADVNGNTIVLYNPVIRYGDQTGSRANLVYGDQDSEIFFRDDEREIKQVKVSENGSFITILTQNGSGSRVLIFDRFGNDLNSMDFDEELEGVALDSTGEFLTVFTSGRVQVYNQIDGERLGSASSRASVIHAEFQPKDDTVIIFGGSVSERQITNPSLTAVHLTHRQIAREDVGFTVSSLSVDDIRISRTGNNRYRIDGLNQPLQVQASW